MSHCFWPKSWGQELVRYSPFFGVRVAKEDSSRFVFDRVQRVCLVNLLGKEIGLSKYNTSSRWVVGEICHTAKTLGLDDRAIVLKEALVVSQVVGEDVEVIADERKSFGAWCVPYRTTVN